MAFFVWDFQFNQMDMEHSTLKTSAVGIAMMVGYVTVDSFTSNFEEMGLVVTTWFGGIRWLIWRGFGVEFHDFSSF